MAMAVVLLHIIFMEVNTSKPLSPEFFNNPRCPLGAVPAEAATINVFSGEAMVGSEREVPAAVLEANISEAGENLSAAEVGLGNKPDSSTRVTGESEEPDVFSGS